MMWAKKAREEHDAFAEALREKGVQVHYYGELLAETLEMPKGRAFVLDRLCTPEMVGPGARRSAPQALREHRRRDTGRLPGRRGPQGRPSPGTGPQPEVVHAAGRRLLAAALCPTICSSGTIPAGSTAGCPSTPWRSPPASASRCTAGPSTGSTPSSPTRISPSTTATTTRTTCRRRSKVGTSTYSGTRAVLIGMGERTTPMAVEIRVPGAIRHAVRPIVSSLSSCPSLTP